MDLLEYQANAHFRLIQLFGQLVIRAPLPVLLFFVAFVFGMFAYLFLTNCTELLTQEEADIVFTIEDIPEHILIRFDEEYSELPMYVRKFLDTITEPLPLADE